MVHSSTCDVHASPSQTGVVPLIKHRRPSVLGPALAIIERSESAHMLSSILRIIGADMKLTM
jgi:hypothetical protein